MHDKIIQGEAFLIGETQYLQPLNFMAIDAKGTEVPAFNFNNYPKREVNISFTVGDK